MILQNLAVKYASNLMKFELEKSLNIEILDSSLKREPQSGKKYMLYSHIPFCHTFCPYCSFHKYGYNEILAKKYFENLRQELRKIKEFGYDFSSMYVGGGTTLIDEDELLKTLELAKKLFNITQISCETDPNHIKKQNLTRFQGLIDRISIGVQSFDDEILKKVARFEKFGSSEILREKISQIVGVLPITSIDLIFNFPFQTKEQLLKDISLAKSLNTEQITFYPLMKSPLTRENIAKNLGVSNVDNEREFYEIINKEFDSYHQNNAWSFSREKHNLKDEYVGSNHEYIGIGSGAFSFLDGKLLINAFNLESYEKMSSSGNTTIAKCEFSTKSRLKYLFLTELFDGQIDIEIFNKTNGVNLKKELFLEILMLKFAKAIKIENGKISPTNFGKYLCVVLMKEFYAGMDKIRAIFKDDTKFQGKRLVKI